MNNLLLIFLVLFLFNCHSSKMEMTKEEFELKIENIKNANNANKKLADGWYESSKTENEFIRIDKNTSTTFYINPKPIILPENFIRSEEFENYQGYKGLSIFFDKIGTKAWSKATNENIGSQLIFILENQVLTAPIVRSQITNGVSAFWEDEVTENQLSKIKAMVNSN